MSDGTEQSGTEPSGTEPSGTEAVRTGEVIVPEGARVVLPDDAITDSAGSLGAAEWPAGEADEPHGQPGDDGEMTPSDPSQPAEQATPPANLAEPLR